MATGRRTSTRKPRPGNNASPPEEARLLKFALSWAASGCGDEYILPEFGLHPHTFYQRVVSILHHDNPRHLSPKARQALLTHCHHKLAVHQPPDRSAAKAVV
ncbi:hypothetical protein [Rhodococcus jostii]|uniref:hypothetical protein n=1 Tax=Rhodococcus jostii TaxID=132919 RepID=UPI003626BB0A